MRQDIITTSFRTLSLFYRWISGRAVESPPNIARLWVRQLVGRYPKRVVIAKQVDPSAGLITCLSSVTILQVSDLLNGPVALRAGSTCMVSRQWLSAHWANLLTCRRWHMLAVAPGAVITSLPLGYDQAGSSAG